jgi:hypothetical protein
LDFGGVLAAVQPSTAMLQPSSTAISLFIGLVLSLVPRRTLDVRSPPVLDATGHPNDAPLHRLFPDF